MDPQFLVFTFLLGGVLLIFAEFFLPSGGLIAVTCAVCFLLSGYYAYQSWYSSAPLYWWMYLGGVVLVVPASIYGAFQLLLYTPLGKKVIMDAPTLEEVTPYQEEQARLEAMIGQRGRALSLMTPGGMVLVNGERLHATAEGLLVEPDSPIEIVGVRGTRVVVRRVDDADSQNDSSLANSDNRQSEQGDPDVVDPFKLDT
jgi:membrane-bound ClpP family serine protease